MVPPTAICSSETPKRITHMVKRMSDKAPPKMEGLFFCAQKKRGEDYAVICCGK